ncbi:hypothetical protein TSUD_312030 [Trifolium subterraneum]|uniref:Uncharacterized protein n=1 Tax=Trifolium subterraneum TaxID=3900 RepID=A0A2Z6M265_TRISU|nr:hypothetical protein TSUD_312030 [Trifolium subterraneum]
MNRYVDVAPVAVPRTKRALLLEDDFGFRSNNILVMYDDDESDCGKPTACNVYKTLSRLVNVTFNPGSLDGLI